MMALQWWLWLMCTLSISVEVAKLHLLSVNAGQGPCGVNEPHFHIPIQYIVYKIILFYQEFHCRWDSILFERGTYALVVERRLHDLILGKTFCADPTQLGTHFSGILSRCQHTAPQLFYQEFHCRWDSILFERGTYALVVERRLHDLILGKTFCADPTQLGTHFSGILSRCQHTAPQ